MFIRTITTLFAAFVVSCRLAGAQTLPVSWDVPKSWELVENYDQRGATIFLYLVRDTKIGAHTDVVSNVLVSFYRLPTGEAAWNPDAIVQRRMAQINGTLIVSGQDDDHWKSYLFTSDYRGQTTLILYRMGLVNGVGAEVMVSFPLVVLDKNEEFAVLTLEPSTIGSDQAAGVFLHPSSARELVDTFNAVCASLKISGASSCTSKAKLAAPPPDSVFYRKDDSGK